MKFLLVIFQYCESYSKIFVVGFFCSYKRTFPSLGLLPQGLQHSIIKAVRVLHLHFVNLLHCKPAATFKIKDQDALNQRLSVFPNYMITLQYT